MRNLDEILKESIPTVVIFQHVGRQDAVELKYMVEDLSNKYDGKANVIRVDASYDEPMRYRYKLKDYPTYILFKKGEELMRESGEKTETEISELIERGL